MRLSTFSVSLLIVMGLSGCANVHSSGVMGGLIDDLISVDGTSLVGFHDPSLIGPKDTVQFGQVGKFDEQAFLRKDPNQLTVCETPYKCSFRLSDKGFRKVQKIVAPMPDNYNSSSDPFLPSYYEVTVTSDTAKNLKFEIWGTESITQAGIVGATEFKKISKTYKAGEIAKVAFTKQKSMGVEYFAQPLPLIAVYSPSERGEAFTVEVFKVKMGK
jgi:hypothetical protein